MMRGLVIALALVAAAPTAFAQAPGQTPPIGQRQVQPPPGPAQRAQNRRERIKKRIRALRAYTLTEELQLDEQTAGKVFPLLAQYDDELDKLLQQRADLNRRLAGVDAMPPKDADKLVDEAIANQRAFWDVEDRRLAALRKVLTPAQIVKLMTVLPALEKRIQNQLKKAIAGGGARGGGGRPGRAKAPPIDDDLDDDDAPPPPPAAKGAKPPCDPFSSMHSCGN